MDELQPAKRREPTRDMGGVWVVLGDEQFKVPPLNFRSLKEFTPKLVSFGSVEPGTAPSMQQMDTVLDVLHASLKRNYPDITRDDLEDRVDTGNMIEVMNAVMSASKLEQGGAPKSGER